MFLSKTTLDLELQALVQLAQLSRQCIPSIVFSGSTASSVSYTTLSTNPNSSSSLAAHTYTSFVLKFVNALLANSASLLPTGVSINVNFLGYKFSLPLLVLTRTVANGGSTDVQTCGTTHLPDESSTVRAGCFVSVSVFNASTKADVGAATQGIVLSLHASRFSYTLYIVALIGWNLRQKEHHYCLWISFLNFYHNKTTHLVPISRKWPNSSQSLTLSLFRFWAQAFQRFPSASMDSENVYNSDMDNSNILPESNLDNIVQPGNIADAQEIYTSPISLLPEDVIREIFLLCVPAKPDAIMDKHKAPIILGQICSSWRTIALSSPELWSSIQIPIPTWSVDKPGTDNFTNVYPDPEKLCETVSLWLVRSGARLLSISTTASDGGVISLTAISLILNTLAIFSSRWQSIHLSLPKRAWNLLACQPLPEMLETLSIAVHPGQGFVMPPEDLNGVILPPTTGAVSWHETKLFQSPHLRNLSIHRACSGLAGITLHWPQLTDLTLGDLTAFERHPPHVSPSAALSILGKCPNLKRCSLTITKRDDVMTENLSTITIPSLTTLEVKEVEGISLARFFHNLRLPSLCHLSFVPGPRTAIWDFYDPLSYLLPGSKTLETLFLDATHLTSENLIDVLRLVPNVRRISLVSFPKFLGRRGLSEALAFDGHSFIRASCLQDHILKYLIPGWHGAAKMPLCPLLEVFECDQGEFLDDYIYLFIKRRIDYPRIATLKRVRITFKQKRTRDIEGELGNQIRRVGLNLKLIYP